MPTIIPFVRDGAFGPDDILAMSRALTEVCRALQLDEDPTAKETVAERIVELARRGERSPTVLRDRVIAEATGGQRP